MEDQLLLALCGTAERRRERHEQIAALAGVADPERFALTAGGQRLRALSLARLAKQDPERFGVEAAQVRAGARPAALAFEAATEHVLDRLAADGLVALPLKGSKLAERLYGDVALRPTADIDVLVARGDIRDALDSVGRLGYLPPTDPVGKDGLPTLHFTLLHPRGLPRLELHWRAHWIDGGFSQGALERSVLEDGYRRPDPVDEVAMLLLFFARDGFAGLRLAADLAAWWDSYGEGIDSGALQRVVEAHGDLHRVLTTSAAVAETLVGVPMARLVGGHGLSRREGMARRLMNWSLRGSLGQAGANVAIADALLAPRGGVPRSIRQDLWPPRAIGPGRFLHVLKRTIRYSRALWSIRRGRWYAPPPATQCALNRPQSQRAGAYPARPHMDSAHLPGSN